MALTLEGDKQSSKDDLRISLQENFESSSRVASGTGSGKGREAYRLQVFCSFASLDDGDGASLVTRRAQLRVADARE
jgi:hypothetical protein